MINFENIININKNQQLERAFNKSFNYYKINNPKVSFLSIEKINLFKKSGSPLNYQNYYEFLSENLSIRFNQFILNLIQYWQTKDSDLNPKLAQYYLYKKFIIDPINGLATETKAKDIITSIFHDCQIIEPNGNEDITECWDIKLVQGERLFNFQIKPESFFRSIHKTSHYSLQKIIRANQKHNNNIFLFGFDKKPFILIRDKNNKTKTRKLYSDEFRQLLSLSPENIKKLSQQTLKNLSLKKIKD